MTTQSLHFELTGQDAERFLSVCQERNIEPKVAFAHPSPKLHPLFTESLP